MKITSNGFTLIELLVTMTIIAILSAVVIGSFGTSQAQARDNARLADLKNAQLAIERYKSDTGQYPEQGCGGETTWTGPGPNSPSWGNDEPCSEYILGLVPEYISELPTDPRFNEVDRIGFLYSVNDDRTSYKLMAHQSMEITTTDLDKELVRCPAICADPSFSNFVGGWCVDNMAEFEADAGVRNHTAAVYSPGAECW